MTKVQVNEELKKFLTICYMFLRSFQLAASRFNDSDTCSCNEFMHFKNFTYQLKLIILLPLCYDSLQALARKKCLMSIRSGICHSVNEMRLYIKTF